MDRPVDVTIAIAQHATNYVGKKTQVLKRSWASRLTLATGIRARPLNPKPPQVLPHNSALSFGLETNRLCTHQILPDRRSDGQRRSDETAFGGVRVSLTLRVVGTFQRPDGSIYGQGARQKSGATTPQAREVDPAALAEEGLRMAEAFRRENVDPFFDWAAHYGEGFDILSPSYTQPARKVVSAEEISRSHTSPKTVLAAEN
ncbi:unnamed protein product [Symbiodinium sp. KB8]|nr:unnamed protein product [Symbiodinium sp. KB8]